MKEIQFTIGDKIRKARRELGMSQRELGKELKMSEMTISYIEMGKRELKLETLIKISEALKVPMIWILEPIL